MSTPLDRESIERTYRRYASFYDVVFGRIFDAGRRRAVEIINRQPGRRVLEVGVGTGLSLPLYRGDSRITGIDVSEEMLEIARRRAAEKGLSNVDGLLNMDAENLAFSDNSFDVAVAMYVASVVSDPVRLLAEMKRVCVPGGDILIVNHLAAKGGGIRAMAERRLAPLSRRLGWRPDFEIDPLLAASGLREVERVPLPPMGLFTLLHCRTTDTASGRTG